MAQSEEDLCRLTTYLLSNLTKDKTVEEKLLTLTIVYDILSQPEYSIMLSMFLECSLLDKLYPLLDREPKCRTFMKLALLTLKLLKFVSKRVHGLTVFNEKLLLKRLLFYIHPVESFFCYSSDFNRAFFDKINSQQLKVYLNKTPTTNPLRNLIKKTTSFDLESINHSGNIYACDIVYSAAGTNGERTMSGDMCDLGYVWPGITPRRDIDEKCRMVNVTHVVENGLFFVSVDPEYVIKNGEIQEILSHSTVTKPLGKRPSCGEYVIANISTNGVSESLHRARVLHVDCVKLTANVFCIDSGHIVGEVPLGKLYPMVHGVGVGEFQPRVEMCVLSGITGKPRNLEMCRLAVSTLCNLSNNNPYIGNYITTHTDELRELLPLLLAPDWSVSINAARMLGNILASSPKAQSINLTPIVVATMQSLSRHCELDDSLTTHDVRHIEARLYCLHLALQKGYHVKRVFAENHGVSVALVLDRRLQREPSHQDVRQSLYRLMRVYVGDALQLEPGLWDVTRDNSGEDEETKKQARSLMFRKTNTTQYYPRSPQQTIQRKAQADDKIKREKTTNASSIIQANKFLDKPDHRRNSMKCSDVISNSAKSRDGNYSNKNGNQSGIEKKPNVVRKDTLLDHDLSVLGQPVPEVNSGASVSRNDDDLFMITKKRPKDVQDSSADVERLSVSRMRPSCSQLTTAEMASNDAEVRDGNDFIDDLPEIILLSSINATHDQHNHFMPNRNIRKMSQTFMKKLTCGLLNAGGGRIYFGISDEGVVDGVCLNHDDRDSLRIGFDHIMSGCFHPKLLPNQFAITIYSVVTAPGEKPLKDLFVVEVMVTALEGAFYSLDDHSAYYRRGSSTVEFINSQEVREFVARREQEIQLRKIADLQRVVTKVEEMIAQTQIRGEK